MCELEATDKHTKLNQKRFEQLKKQVQSQIGKAEFEVQRLTKEIEESASEGIPQTEREIESKKEARRNIERQVKEIKEGKGDAQSQIEAIQREIQ
jgi:hypothetical protein